MQITENSCNVDVDMVEETDLSKRAHIVFCTTFVLRLNRQLAFTIYFPPSSLHSGFLCGSN